MCLETRKLTLARSMIKAENLSVGIGLTTILQDINWTVKRGEHWIITGQNGAGKSTLARSLVGKTRKMKGSLRFPFLGAQPDFDRKKRAVALVSFTDTSKLFRSANIQHYYQQRYHAFDADGHLTVRSYLEAGNFSADDPAHQRILKLLRLEDLLDKERIKLSSGQTRKMLLAKALIKRPELLILDNPYIGLDIESRELLNDTLDELAAAGEVTLILAGQYDALPACISHRIHLEEGKCRAIGALAKVNEEVKVPSATSDAATLQQLKAFYQTQGAALDVKHVVKLDKVTVRYGTTTILDQVDWAVTPGEKWMLRGENGAGKSTLLSLIYGDNPQAYGLPVYLFDKKRGKGQSIWSIKKRIGFTSPELHAYYDEDHTAKYLVWSGLSDNFYVEKRVSDEHRAFVEALFRYFGIEKHYNQNFSQLSTGVQRLIFFMRALVKAPPVLLLDEPFQGFDPQTISACQQLLDALLDERFTLIFISHFEHEVPSSVDQVYRLMKD